MSIIPEKERLALAGAFASAMGTALGQTYRKVGDEWWLYTKGKPARTLKPDEVEWHVARRHAPFVEGGITTDDARWWDDPTPQPSPATVEPDRNRGLYRKFNVTRTDGSSEPGGKHYGCEYFVIDMTHDAHARAALLAYADSCEAQYPMLARDLRSKFGIRTVNAAPQPSPATEAGSR